mgnify:CR=1 FL=1
MSAPSFSVGRKKPSPVAVGRPVPPPPNFDDSELRRRLRELEGRVIPQFDPSALQARLAELESRQAPVFDPSDLQRQIRELGQRPGRDDFMSIERQLQDLRNRDVPQFDPSNLQSQIGGLEDRLANIPQFDPSQLQAGIAGLEDRLANIPQFDPSQLQQQIQANRDLLGNIPQFDDSALRERLQALEGREIPQFDPSQLQAGIQGLSDRISNLPQFDPSALQNRLSELENRKAPTFNPEDFREQFLNIAREGIDIPQPTQAFDPSGLQNRLQALENREMPQFDPSRLQERLSALENVQPVAAPPAFDPSGLQARLDALENREPVAAPPAFDPSGLQARLDALENREPVAAPPAFDPSGLMARLDDFESRLGALQQPLPIQPPGDTDLGIKQDRPDPRDFAKPLPGGGTIYDEVPNSGISPPRPPKPVELDFGFGPGIRPSEIIGRDGEFVGSGGVTPPQPPQDTGPRIGNYDLEREPQPGLTIPVSGAGTNFRPEPPMSIGGPGGGVTDMRARDPFGPRQLRDDLVFPGGSRTFDERGETLAPVPLTEEEKAAFGPPPPPGAIDTRGSTVGPPAYTTGPASDNRFQLKGSSDLVSDGPPETVVAPQPVFNIMRPPADAQVRGTPTDPVEDPGSPNNMRLGNANFQLGPMPSGSPVADIAPDPVGVSQDLSTGDEMQTPTLANEQPFAAGVTQVATGLDPLTEQLLFGIGGQGGFIPGAMRAAEKVFYDDQGNPVVIDEQVAGFSPDQLQAMQMQREALGMQDPYLQGAGQAFGAGTQALEEGLQRGRTAAIGALEATKGGVGSLQEGLGESADILRGTLGGYDPSMTDRFYDPFEDRVVQQTITDIMEQGAKSDIGARASDIARGGESAFGSRARLGAGERQEALGRGLAEALGGIRSRGFREAQQTGLGEFARQKAAERAASTGLASLAGQGFGGSQALAGALSGLGQTEQDIGQQRYSGQFGLGTSLQGLGAQAAGASASDIAALYGMGSQQQGQAQAMLDAQRRNLQQRQMTPLLQYQALAPFISMAPAGQFTTTTQFAPPPSPMQSGLSTGLAAFGALGKLYGGSS